MLKLLAIFNFEVLSVYSPVCLQGTTKNSILKCLKRDFKNAMHLYLVYCQNALSKSSFNKVLFMCPAISFLARFYSKIVKLIFPHKLRVCNAICVAYHVVYRVVVSYLLHVMWKHDMIATFSNAPREIKTRFANLKNAMKRYPTCRHDCM